MQLLPQVASATVTLITLFTCGSNVVQCKCSRSLCVFFRSLKEAFTDTLLRRLPLDYGL